MDRDGHPVAGAAVRLLAQPSRFELDSAALGAMRETEGTLVAATGPDGGFHLAGVSPGRFTLVTRREGFAPQVVREVEVPAGQDHLDLGTVFLGPDAEIAGTVVDGRGQPVSGASVFLAVTVSEPEAHYRLIVGGSQGGKTTGEDGTFHFTGLAPGDRFDLEVKREGFLIERLPHVPAPPRSPLRVVLRPASSVRGRVVTVDDRPVAAAQVSVAPAEGAFGLQLLSLRAGRDVASLSNADGGFLVTDVEPGPAILSVRAAGHPPKQQRVVVPDAASDDPRQEVEVVLETGVEVTGYVVDERRTPIAGASVSILGGPATRSGEDGSFVLDGVASGPRRIVAEDATGARASRSLLAGTETDVELVIAGGLLLRGRVREAGGDAVEGAAVVLVSHRDGEAPRLALSDAQGGFAFNHLAGGTYDLRASKVGLAGASLTGVEVGPTQIEDETARAAPVAPPAPDIELVLSPGVVVRGHLLGFDPADYSTVAVGAAGPSGRRLGGTVDDSGDYQISGLEPGSWVLRATIPGSGKAAEADLALPADEQEVRLDLSFRAGASLSGTAFLQGGPLAGAVLTLTTPDGTVAGIDTSSYQGTYRFSGLKTGRYVLALATAEGDLQCQQPVAVAGDTELSVQLQTVRLAVTVLAQGSSTPVAGATIALEPAASASADLVSQARATQTDGEGRGAMSRILRQAYQVHVEAAGYAPGTLFFDAASAPAGGAELTVLLAPAPPVPGG